jgi:phage terminase large subunit GpA-like protein
MASDTVSRPEKPSALALIAARLADLVDVPPREKPSVWAARNFRVPDGPFAGKLWNPSLTPWWCEPLDDMGPDSDVNKGVVRKGAQSGATVFGLAFLAHSIIFDPCRMMVVQPTDTALTKFSRGKLQPVIDKAPELRRRIRSQTSRSASGSTTYIKAFPGGELILALASSASDLSGDTIKKILKDEVDRYPEDVGGEGPPSKLIESRRKTFSVTGDWKELAISTPTIKGASEIDEEFEAGDRRWWHIVCPECGEKVRLLRQHFKFDRQPPYNPHYVMQCCGVIVGERRMRRLIQHAAEDGGGWIPLNPGAPHRSWHFDDLTSPFETWSNIARLEVEAEGDPAKEASLVQRTWAQAYEAKGDARDHAELMARREDYPAGVIPPKGLIVTAFADVQHNGIWVEVVAWGWDRQSWVIEARFLPGDTTDHHAGAFAALHEQIYSKRWPDSFGRTWPLDALGIDSGDNQDGRAHQVYAFARTRHGVFATRGVGGWSAPALGTPAKKQVVLAGKRDGRIDVWPIGTWSLKSVWYTNLEKVPFREGMPIDIPGAVHFHGGLDEGYFLQVTSEYLETKRINGRPHQEWRTIGKRDNHLLDCRIGNMAMAEAALISARTPEQWAARARERGLPEDLAEPSLFRPATVPSVTRDGETAGAWVADEGPAAADWVEALAGLAYDD